MCNFGISIGSIDSGFMQIEKIESQYAKTTKKRNEYKNKINRLRKQTKE